METRASYALVGASIIVGIVAFIGFILWLGQVQFNRSFAEYDVVFDGAVNGLSEGGQVRYLGISVGEVTDLSLDATSQDRVVARIRIDSETPVREDSKAILDFAGLTGVTFIQIRPGTPDSPLLPKRTGSNLPRLETERTALAEIFESGEDLMSNAQITMSRINELMDAENQLNFKETLANIETITRAFAEDEELLGQVADAIAKLAEAGESVGEAADSFAGIGEDARGALQRLTAKAEGLFDQASDTIETAESAIERSEQSITETRRAVQEPTVQAIDEIQLLAQDLRLLIRRIDQIARELEQNPQAFVQGSPKPYRDDE